MEIKIKSSSSFELTKKHTNSLQKAIKSDLGSNAVLKYCEINDFTKIGDNFVTYVTASSCTVELQNKQHTVTYILKLDPGRPMNSMKECVSQSFKREAKFLLQILPELNKILVENNLSEMNFPKCYFGSWAEDLMLIILRDMRQDGFHVNRIAKEIGYNFTESASILSQLAKLHASSYVLLKTSGKQYFYELFPFLKEQWLPIGSMVREQWRKLHCSSFQTAEDILSEIGGYEDTVEWLRKENPLSIQIQDADIEHDTMPQFRVICHGDFWGNNILVKQDVDSTDIGIVDFQFCRAGSLATDIQRIVWCPHARLCKHSVDVLLDTYYCQLHNIFNSLSHKVPFTREDLGKEFKRNKKFGIATALSALTLEICTKKGIMDINSLCDDKLDSILKEMDQYTKYLFKTNDTFRENFLEIFTFY